MGRLGIFLAGCSSSGQPGNGVTGTAIDTYDPGTGMTQRVPVPRDTWASIGAQAGGSSYPGSIDDKGIVDIPGVPEGGYWLRLESPAPRRFPGAQSFVSYDELAARVLDLGVLRTHRTGLKEMTKSSLMVLSATLTTPWQRDNEVSRPVEDILELFSRRTGVVGDYYASAAIPGADEPAHRAMAIAGWKLDAFDAYPYTDAGVSQYEGDDVTFLHQVDHAVTDMGQSADSAWREYNYQSVQASFKPGPVTLSDGGMVALNGAFMAAPQKVLALDYRGSAFNHALSDAPQGVRITSVGVNLFVEPGAPVPGEGADAFLLGLWVSSQTAPPGDYRHDFSYGNPFDYGQEMVWLDISFSASVQPLLKDPSPESLIGGFSMQAPLENLNGGLLQPEIGLPRNVTVAGQATPIGRITTGVGLTPGIAFQPPSFGKADGYSIRVVQLDDQMDANGIVLRRRTVARIDASSTSLTLPAGILQSGRSYYLQISAYTTYGTDPSKPFAYYPHRASADTVTGVIIP